MGGPATIVRLFLGILLVFCVSLVVILSSGFFDCSPDQEKSWGEWTNNSKCSTDCGCGTLSQTRVCPTVTTCRNKLCVGGEKEHREVQCCAGQVDGHWTEWSAEPHCSVTCGVGTLLLKRKCLGAKCRGKCDGSSSNDTGVACNNGPCDPDVIRVVEPVVLRNIMNIGHDSKKKVMILFAQHFLDHEHHRFLEGLIIQAQYYRELGEELQAPTGIAFVAVSCNYSPQMDEECAKNNLIVDDAPKLIKFDESGAVPYSTEALLKGKLAKEIHHSNNPLLDLNLFDKKLLDDLTKRLEEATEKLSKAMARKSLE
eukprot:m.32260 g.32260  ORF g.32260 m.32260 type:complete len:312 (-) comp8392_c0_seq2:113-1048(-)